MLEEIQKILIRLGVIKTKLIFKDIQYAFDGELYALYFSQKHDVWFFNDCSGNIYILDLSILNLDDDFLILEGETFQASFDISNNSKIRIIEPKTFLIVDQDLERLLKTLDD